MTHSDKKKKKCLYPKHQPPSTQTRFPPTLFTPNFERSLGVYFLVAGLAAPYLLVPDAVVDEHEDAVQRVEDAEGHGDGQRRPVQVEEREGPGEHHEEQQRGGAPQPHPGGERVVRGGRTGG